MDLLVCLHGFTDDGSVWAPTIERLGWRDAFEVRTPSAIGHGGRPFTADALRLDDLAGEVIASLDRPAVLIGHSMGALTAERAAAGHPGLVRAVVLEDPPWGDPPDPDHAEAARAELVAWIAGLQAADQTRRLAWLDEQHPGWPEAERDPWAASKAAVDPALLAVRGRWMGETWESDVAALTCPALLLAGEEALGGAIEERYLQRARTLNPGVQLHRVEGAGHSVRRDRPDRYDELVSAFLASLP
jgi:pimeloyl-ACP methyl ester carboxylesterase